MLIHKNPFFRQYKVHTMCSSFTFIGQSCTEKQRYTTIIPTNIMEKTMLPTSHLEQSNSKTNVLQKLLLLTKLQKRQKLCMKCKTFLSRKAKAEGLLNKIPKNNNNASDAKLQQQLTKLDDHKPLQQQILKPSTTVTGFKKLMYNFVKLSQNQLQPSYNRRKYNHTHYNQTLKERTRLSRTYVYLSKPTIKNYCAFTIKPTSSMYSLQNFISSIDNPFYGGTLQTFAPAVCEGSFTDFAPKFVSLEQIASLRVKTSSSKFVKEPSQTKLSEQACAAASGSKNPVALQQNTVWVGIPSPQNKNLLSASLKANSESFGSKTTLPAVAGGKPSTKKPPLISVRSLIKNNNKIRLENPPIAYHRPIPKIVNLLESRLDVILWKNQFAGSIKSARQNLRQGVLVNGGLQKKTSFQALPGDVFTFNK
uniref:Ribosomal protein S4 n=1 Tax=Tupiella akineta TaxID=160070 RepID=Q6UVU2_TUPAK|nr:ribosomal protein S4 [Tupiella akineta]AAQ18732.1 ribosomal protein S4 [Tupiella akineta]